MSTVDVFVLDGLAATCFTDTSTCLNCLRAILDFECDPGAIDAKRVAGSFTDKSIKRTFGTALESCAWCQKRLDMLLKLQSEFQKFGHCGIHRSCGQRPEDLRPRLEVVARRVGRGLGFFAHQLLATHWQGLRTAPEAAIVGIL